MPYNRAKDSDGLTFFEVTDKNGRVVANVFTLKHARLFAMAPDLLERAEEALAYVKLFGQVSLGRKTSTVVAQKLQAAITVAKGEELDQREPMPEGAGGRNDRPERSAGQEVKTV